MDFANIQQIASYYESNIYKKWIEWVKMYYQDMTEREQYLTWDWQSNVSCWILNRVVNTFAAHLYDNSIKFNVVWNTEKDNKKAKAVQDVLTWSFQVSNSKQVMYEILNDALLLWEWYWRMEYEYVEDKVEFITPTGKKRYTTRKKNNPKLRYVSPFDIMIDPGATSWKDARYIIERNIVPVNSINEKYWIYFKLTDKQIDKLKNDAVYLFSRDYNLEKNKIIYNSAWVSDINAVNSWYTFDKNYYLEVVEVWTDDKLSIYVNWHKLYDDINPYPLKKKPYIQIVFNKVNGLVRWIWLYNLLSNIELTGNTILNVYLDNLKLKTIPAFVRVVWPNSLDTLDTVLDIEPWKVIPVEDPNAVQPLQLWNADPQLLTSFQFLLQEAFMIAGVNEIVMGSTLQKVDRSAASTISRVQWFKTRMLPLFDSINDAMWDIAEMWLAMIIAYNSDWSKNSLEVRIFDDVSKKTVFKQIKLEDLEWQFDVIFDSMAMKNALKEIALQKQMQLLQLAGQIPVDPNTQEPLFNFKELIKHIIDNMDLSSDVLLDEKKSKKIKQQLLEQQLAMQWQVLPSQWNNNQDVEQMQKADETTQQQAQPNESWTDMLQKALNFNW